MPSRQPALAAIHRYPVKGLPGETLGSVRLQDGEGLPFDRRFALTSTVSSTMDGQWMPCRSFLINAVDDGLLRLETHFDHASGTVSIAAPWGGEIAFRAGDSQSIASANANLPLLLEPFASAMPPMVGERSQMPGMASGYWDFINTPVSIINLASIRDLSQAMGVELDPRRFRGNLLLDGLEPWEEFGLAGKRIRFGSGRSAPELEIIRPALRCPATSIDPLTGIRNTDTPNAMQEHFGHAWMGMYAHVVKGGELAVDAPVEIIGDSRTSLAEAAANGAPDYKLWPKMALVKERNAEDAGARITLVSATNWPLPDAAPGQRLRLHLGADLWTAADITSHDGNATSLEVTPSATGDPATASLLETVHKGSRIIVSGPFGKA